MNEEVNVLHLAIGRIFQDFFENKKDFELLRDEACGGNQRIPLFCVSKKSRQSEYCNVDMMVLKNNKVKIIIEIEESDVKPTQVCGKFLTSALARYYIHESKCNEPIEMDDSVTFIQIVDASKLVKDKTRKFEQWDALKESIRELLPLKNGSKIKRYDLVYDSGSDFSNKPNLNRLVSIVEEACL
jgi:hypothetical protein